MDVSFDRSLTVFHGKASGHCCLIFAYPACKSLEFGCAFRFDAGEPRF